MIAADDHRLLMEALMFFSPGDDHDDHSTSTTTTNFDMHKELASMERIHAHPRPCYTNEQSRLDTRLNTRIRQLPFGATTDNVASVATASLTAPPISPPPKEPLRRKRVKKCTYAARREEVARLRSWTVQLETQLTDLHEHLRRREYFRQQAHYERELLAQSRAEHARLRAIVAANNARVAEMEAHQVPAGNVVLSL